MPLYAAKAASAATSDLYTLDPATAAATSLGATGHAFTGLALDPTDGTLYGASSPNSSANPKCLFTIDPDTGVATLVGQFTRSGFPTTHHVMSDLAFDSAGQLYGWSGQTGQIHPINKADAIYTYDLASSALGAPAAAITFDADDTLFYLARVSGNTRLYTVSTDGDGDPTLVGALTPSTSLYPSAAAFSPDDGLIYWLNGGFGGTGVRLRTLDPAGLDWVVVGASATDPGDDFDALAFGGDFGGGGISGYFRKVRFGNGIAVTDEGRGVIRVDAV